MKTILVIEDSQKMRDNISEILRLAPYDVVQAASGKEGIERARLTRPDLILCDIMMPELDGFGVLHILSNDPVLADVPFVFLTAKAEPVDFRTGLSLGADDYLTKPFDDFALLDTVALRLHKAERGQNPPATNPVDFDQLTRALLNETDAIHSLCENYPTLHYVRKQRLITAGGWPTALYFIDRGQVKLSKTDPAGNEYITALLGPGDFIGHLALLEEVTYAETAEVIDDLAVCVIPKADFLSLIYHHPEVANRFIRLLAGEVADQQERLLKLAYQSVRMRVVEALLTVWRRFYGRSDGHTALVGGGRSDRPDGRHVGDPQPGIPMLPNVSVSPTANTSLPMTLSRNNWSHLVGASHETVSRVLGDLRAEGLISLSASQITLLDIDRLTRLKY